MTQANVAVLVCDERGRFEIRTAVMSMEETAGGCGPEDLCRRWGFVQAFRVPRREADTLWVDVHQRWGVPRSSLTGTIEQPDSLQGAEPQDFTDFNWGVVLSWRSGPSQLILVYDLDMLVRLLHWLDPMRQVAMVDSFVRLLRERKRSSSTPRQAALVTNTHNPFLLEPRRVSLTTENHFTRWLDAYTIAEPDAAIPRSEFLDAYNRTRIETALLAVSPKGMTKTVIHGLFRRHADITITTLDAALTTLTASGRIQCSTPDTGRGRRPSVYTAVVE